MAYHIAAHAGYDIRKAPWHWWNQRYCAGWKRRPLKEMLLSTHPTHRQCALHAERVIPGILKDVAKLQAEKNVALHEANGQEAETGSQGDERVVKELHGDLIKALAAVSLPVGLLVAAVSLL